MCDVNYLSIDTLQQALSSIDVRRDLFNNGRDTAELFLTKLKDCVQELS